jgi:three-Cys-motif partner protein
MLCTQKRYHQHSQKIAYIDLFAGPGRFKDGTQSTPLKILTNAIEKLDLRERLVSIFNDKDEKNSNDLQKTIAEIPRINTLKYKPIVYNQEVGEENAIFFLYQYGHR